MPSLLGKVLTYLLKFNKVPKAPIDIMDGPSAELNRNFSKHCGFRVTKHPFNSSGVFFFRGGRTLMPFSLVPYPTRLRLVSMHLYCSFYRVQALDFTYVMQKCLHLGACVQILNNKLRLFRELPLIPKPTLYKNNLISLPKLTGVRAFCANFKQTGLLAGVSVHKLKHTPLRFVVSNEGNRLRGILVGSSKDVGVNTRGDRPESLVLTEVPASSLAAMFGYTRRYQKTPFIRLSLFKHFRRYFLVLDQLTLNLTLKGVMRQFKVYFKTLNTPLNQIIKNPVTNQ